LVFRPFLLGYKRILAGKGETGAPWNQVFKERRPSTALSFQGQPRNRRTTNGQKPARPGHRPLFFRPPFALHREDIHEGPPKPFPNRGRREKTKSRPSPLPTHPTARPWSEGVSRRGPTRYSPFPWTLFLKARSQDPLNAQRGPPPPQSPLHHQTAGPSPPLEPMKGGNPGPESPRSIGPGSCFPETNPGQAEKPRRRRRLEGKKIRPRARSSDKLLSPWFQTRFTATVGTAFTPIPTGGPGADPQSFSRPDPARDPNPRGFAPAARMENPRPKNDGAKPRTKRRFLGAPWGAARGGRNPERVGRTTTHAWGCRSIPPVKDRTFPGQGGPNGRRQAFFSLSGERNGKFKGTDERVAPKKHESPNLFRRNEKGCSPSWKKPRWQECHWDTEGGPFLWGGPGLGPSLPPQLERPPRGRSRKRTKIPHSFFEGTTDGPNGPRPRPRMDRPLRRPSCHWPRPGPFPSFNKRGGVPPPFVAPRAPGNIMFP